MMTSKVTSLEAFLCSQANEFAIRDIEILARSDISTPMR